MNKRKPMASRYREETYTEATITLVVAVIGVGAWLLAGYRIAQLFGG